MELGSIDRELHVDAPPEVVWEVLTSPAYIRDWWRAEVDFEPVAGTQGALTFTDDTTGEQKSAPFTIVVADPPRLLSFRWTYDDGATAAPGNSLLVTFELTAAGEGTTVSFHETGYRERGWEAAVLEEYYNDHRQGWEFFLPRLAATAHQRAGAR